jgi:hypothetical protein
VLKANVVELAVVDVSFSVVQHKSSTIVVLAPQLEGAGGHTRVDPWYILDTSESPTFILPLAICVPPILKSAITL